MIQSQLLYTEIKILGWKKKEVNLNFAKLWKSYDKEYEKFWSQLTVDVVCFNNPMIKTHQGESHLYIKHDSV